MNRLIRGINYHIEYYYSHNSLPTLFMLHGFLGSSGSFSHLIESLRTAANILLIDLIGHGKTDSPPYPKRYTYNEQIEDLKEILQDYGRNLYLHGYSMGGRLALQYTCQYPDNLKGLILESTTAGIDNPTEKNRRKAIDHARATQIIKDKDNFIKEWNTSPLFTNKNLPADLEIQLIEMQQAQNPVGLQNSLLGFGTGTMPSLHDKLVEIQTPCLILTGEKDQKFIREGNILARRIPTSKHITIEQASHRVHLDHPDAYLKHTLDFITGTR